MCWRCDQQKYDPLKSQLVASVCIVGGGHKVSPPPYKYPLNFEPFWNHTLVSLQQVNLILSWKSSSLALLPTVPVSFCWVVHVAWCIVGIWPADSMISSGPGLTGKFRQFPEPIRLQSLVNCFAHA